MIDKLNFSGANPNFNIESPQSSIGDTLLNFGKYFNQKDALEQERLAQAKRDEYRISRDMIADARYDADKKLQADEKARLLNKEYNTGRAALALTDPNALKKEAMYGEQKAIESTLANASPEDRLLIQQQLKGYNPAESAKGWVDTALGQSNVDAGMITNLKRDIVKQAADEKYKNESLALQKRQNEIASQARADSLKLQRDELEFKKQQLMKPELSAKQKEFKGNLALFGNDEEKAGIATFGADDWKKIKGTYQDETKKKEYAVGGFKNDDILKKSAEGLGTWTDSGAQENAAKTRTTLENMQRAMQLPNSEMERIIPLIVGTGGEINKDALDTIYGNKIALDQSGNIIKMSDAFTKIANNPKDFITVTNEGKTQLLPVQSDAAKKLITNMGPEAMDYYGIKPSETTKDMQKGIAGSKPSEPGGDTLLNKKLDSVVTKPGQLTKEEYLKQTEERKALGKELTKDVSGLIGETFSGSERNRIAFETGIVNKVKNGEQLSAQESQWINQMRNSQRPYDRFRLKELGIE